MRQAVSLKGWLVGLVILLATGGLTFTALAMRTEANMTFASGQKLSGPFADYWKGNGGVARFGQPLTGVYTTSDGYAAQIFERAAFVYDRGVLEYPVGWAAMSARCTEPAFERTAQANGSGNRYFPTTGHSLSGAFLDYWNAHNGLTTYGYPLSEEFTEKLGDGNSYTVQYFERARFELQGTGVQLGLLGSELLASQGGAAAFANLPTPASYQAQGQTQQQQNGIGHAPDYSWVVGRVNKDTWNGTGPAPMRPSFPPSVVSGSSLLPAPVPESQPTPLPNGVIVGHAEHSDVSPPLRDIKPRPPIPECSPQAGYTFVPTGPGWDPTNLKDGEYVRLTGHLAAPGEVQSMGDQGRVYVVDKVEIVK